MRSSSEENFNDRSKPEANVTLVTSSRPIPFNEQQKFNSNTYTRHNGHSYHQKNSSFANQNSLPPRFQRQRRAENSEFDEHQYYTKRRPSYSSRRSTFYSSRGRIQHQFRTEPNSNNNNQVRSESPQEFLGNSSVPVPNEYSSESENLSGLFFQETFVLLFLFSFMKMFHQPQKILQIVQFYQHQLGRKILLEAST